MSKEKLQKLATGVGSLPHTNSKDALDLITKSFPDFPFWPQLGNLSPEEDMMVQYNEKVPGVIFDEADDRWYIDQEDESFFEQLEEFFMDYEEIVSEKNWNLLDKYAISDKYCSSFDEFLNILKKTQPIAIKGQIVGPFTYTTSLVDREKKCAFYDDTLREVAVKGLTLKALWQLKHFKEVSPNSIPVMFMDEPSISQYGTSAFLTVSKEDILSCIDEIANIMKENGALVGVHCCGKTDWSLVTSSQVDVLNFDAYAFSESLSLYSKEIEDFLKRGGMIAWGIVPTLDVDALEKTDINELKDILAKALNYLCDKGIDRELLLKSSIITPSCGAGGLSVELAQKALTLASELSKLLKAGDIK